MKGTHREFIYRLSLSLCLIVFSVVLFSLILNASRMRLSGDDYCYIRIS